MPTANVLICSGGRRNYLVRWFREAMEKIGVDGDVCVIDANPYAPALASADRARVVPPLTDPAYEFVLDGLLEEWSITLTFSLNDYELAAWEGPVWEVFERRGVLAATVPPASRRVVEDKLSYRGVLAEMGVRTPDVVSGRDVVEGDLLPQERGGGFVIKHRFGSASAGLKIVSSDRVRDALHFQASLARDRHGRLAHSLRQGLELLVVQTRVEGDEYGLDVVNDLDSRFQGALARQKLRMRSGETDQAKVVDAETLLPVAEGISQTLGHRGLVDADVIIDGDDQWVIDINPRFGGGYPFSHLGGADVPACYLAWHLGLEIEESWLLPRPGVISAKAESMNVVADPGSESKYG